MSINARVQLTGFLGEDAKRVSKDGRSYTILSVATTDSYPVEKESEIVWKDNATKWHEVFVFNPVACSYANDLKKSNKVEIQGSISYRLFKDERGYNRKQAIIVGNFVQRHEYNKQEILFAERQIDECLNQIP